jgi:hypothetical protein
MPYLPSSSPMSAKSHTQVLDITFSTTDDSLTQHHQFWLEIPPQRCTHRSLAAFRTHEPAWHNWLARETFKQRSPNFGAWKIISRLRVRAVGTILPPLLTPVLTCPGLRGRCSYRLFWSIQMHIIFFGHLESSSLLSTTPQQTAVVI